MPIFESRISNRLDYSENVLLVSIDNGAIRKRQSYYWARSNALERIDLLRQFGVDVLICDGITEFYANQFENSSIKVIPWISGEVDQVLTQYLAGTLARDKLTSEGD